MTQNIADLQTSKTRGDTVLYFVAADANHDPVTAKHQRLLNKVKEELTAALASGGPRAPASLSKRRQGSKSMASIRSIKNRIGDLSGEAIVKLQNEKLFADLLAVHTELETALGCLQSEVEYDLILD